MDDDKVGIVSDDNLDEADFPAALADGDLDEEDLGVVSDIDDVLHDEIVEEDVGDFFLEEDDTLGTVKKKRPVIVDEETEGFEEVFDDEEDDEEEFYSEEDDEARYNFRVEEDPLDEGY